MKVLGIDPSLTGTGLAAIHIGQPGQAEPFMTEKLKTPASRATGLDRIHLVQTYVYGWLTGVDLAVIEGPAYSRQNGAGHHEAAGLWWMLADLIATCNVPMAVVPPSVRAKYATGKGNAGKDAVLAAVVRRYATLDEIETNDEADAVVLAAMGAAYLFAPQEAKPLPKANRDALDKVSWPGRLDQ